MQADPRDVLSKSPMTTMQVIIVAITVGLNALDGFDVLSISFASPGIAAEWGIDRAALGFVLSMELIGMALGSILLGGVADKIGRRPTVIGCLALMATGMFMVTTSSSFLGGFVTPVLALFGLDVDARLADLSVWRVFTGLGIGGMLASINAVAAEFSSSKRRDFSVAIMSIGYPVGAAAGGFVTSSQLELENWRLVFYFGGTVTLLFIPLVYFMVPESVHWLARKQPEGALERMNATLRRIGHATVNALPAMTSEVRRRSIGDIFRRGLVATTIIVTAAYFFHITTFYFLVKWVPTIVVGMGFAPSSAGYILSWVNVGGATGGTVIGLLAHRYGIKGLTIGVMLMSTVLVTLFGRTPADFTQLAIICAFSGFCTNAAITGMYAIFAKAFPTHVRAFGTGFAVGVGRGGSVLAPIIAGYLFTWGFELPNVAMTMALGSLAAAVVLLFLKLSPERTEAQLAAQQRDDEVVPELKGAVAPSR